MQRSGHGWRPVKDGGDPVVEPQFGLHFQETKLGDRQAAVELRTSRLTWARNLCLQVQMCAKTVRGDSGDLRLRDLEKLRVLKDLGMVQSVKEKPQGGRE